MTHTPGPWVAHWNMGSGDHHWIMKMPGDERVGIVHAFAPTDGDMELQGKANARLIAAAPELLEALEIMVDAIGEIEWHKAGYSTNARHMAKSAIAKAKGE